MSVIAKRYSEALLEIALENNAVEKYEIQLDELLEIIDRPDIKEIINYPEMKLSDKKQLLNSISKEFDSNVINLINVMIDNRRQSQIRDVIIEYRKLSDEYKKLLYVEITTSSELTKDEIDKINLKMKQMFNKEQIKNRIIIDPSVLGGVKIKAGDTIIDGTLKSRLDTLRREIVQK